MKYNVFLQKLDHCPFCVEDQYEIISGEKAILTYSIAPYTPNHLLVTPRRHVELMEDIENDEMIEIDQLLRKGVTMLKKLGHETLSILVREGENSGRSIKHVHYHIVPDVPLSSPNNSADAREVMTEEEVKLLVERFNKLK